MTIKVTYNVTDVYVTQDVSPVYINVSYSSGSSGGSAVWGGITGTLSDQTDLQTALDLKVPYTGATTNVNLGEYEIKAGQVTLDTSPTGTAAVGTTRWNDTIGSSETTLKGGSVILKNGVDLVARVVNKVSPNTTLTKAAYQAVRVSGAQGQRLAVSLAQANNDANSADTIGLVTETIATNQEGFIITVGQLENINTTGSLQGETWADGDVLYLSPTTAGAITKVKPTGNGHIVVIGYVEYAHANNGKIYVKVMNGWELDELHDVAIVTPLNNEALIYESATALWKNKSIATALGYTPANAATTLTINGVSYDLSANRSWTVSAGISGSGASGQVAYWDGTSAQSGSNNLFWDNANIRLGIGTNTPDYAITVRRPANGLIASFGSTNQKGVTITESATGSGLITSNNYDVADPTTGISLGAVFGFNGSTSNFYGIGISAIRATKYDIWFQTGNANGGGYRFYRGTTELMTLFNTGNLGIGTGATDGGQRLQVQGTTLLNGNVTFSSSTGMFWDATNNRLGIGTNAPASKLNVVGDIAVTTTSIFGATTPFVSSNHYFEGTNNSIPTFIIRASIGNGSDIQRWYNGNTLMTTLNASGDFSTGRIRVSANGPSFPGLSFSTNTQSGIGYSSGVTFITSNTERARVVDSTGNFLINSTTDTGERLQVTGTMKVTGAVTLQNTAGANRSTQLSTSLSSNGLASLLFYPSEGTNVGQSFDIMPRGTGFSSTQKAQFAIWGTDYVANQTNYELLLMRTTGTSYTFESFQGGTGSHRPLLFSAGLSNQFWVYTSGNIGINTSSDVTSALLHMTSTTKGFLPPRMTTTQKNAISSPAAGLVVYDTTLAKLCVYTTAWETITSV